MKLIEQILSDRNLTEACIEVIKNKGASGIDGMRVDNLKNYLDKYREQLKFTIRNGLYIPSAIRGKEIPKDNGKVRLLGIPTVIDRMLQQAVSRVLMLHYERVFSTYSYGFRPKRNTHQAISKSMSYINSGYENVIEIDLKGFFDNVDHVLLLQLIYRTVKCKETMCLIRRWLRTPLELNGKLEKRRIGVPQGSPISPLLSNIILNELDQEMERLGLRFVRYADDFSIYCKTKSEARQANQTIYLYLRDQLKLPINQEKSGIRRPLKFQILGYGFIPNYGKTKMGKFRLTVMKKRWQSLKVKLKEITRKTRGLSLTERIQQLNDTQRGWVNYFKYANMQSKLKRLDRWVRKRIRYCIWHDWKIPERRRKNLIRLGVKQGMAYAWSRTRKGGWAIAQSPILETTITLSRLKKIGYISMEEVYREISPRFGNQLTFPMV